MEIFNCAAESPRVRPILTIAIGSGSCCAARIKRYDDITSSDEPATNTESLLLNCSFIKATNSRLTLSPKNVTSGFTRPEHRGHRGG